MRILQLDIEGRRVEFHPYVTIVRVLDGGLHDRLLSVLAAVSAGEPTVDGLVEAHGVMLDLDAETLELLDLGGTAKGDIDIVVRREQLPGRAAPDATDGRAQLERARGDAASRVARAEAELEGANVALVASRAALESNAVDLDAPRTELERLTHRRELLQATVDAARADHAAAQETQSRAEERVEQAQALRSESARGCSVAAGALEAARSASDPFAATTLEAARDRLAALQAAAEHVEAAREEIEHPADLDLAYVDDEFDDPGVALEALEIRRLEFEASLLALDTVDPYPVRSALEQLRSADDEGELVPSVEAAALADELERAGGPVTDHSGPDLSGGSAMAEARKRLEDARTALFHAEHEMRLPEVDRDDAAALEHAHEELLVTLERAEKRFGGAKARERLEALRQAEQAILDRLGFVSYTDFFVGTSVTNVDLEREEHLEAARAELAEAEDALAALEAGIDTELARAALLGRRRELHGMAIALLGRDPGEDVIWALRHHRVRVHDSTTRAERLRDALESAGVVLGEEAVPQWLLVDIAHIWLDEQTHTNDRREQLFHQLADIEARASVARELVRMRRDREPATETLDDDAGLDPVARRRAQLDEAAAAVLAAELRLARQADIELDIAQKRADLEAATRTEAAVAAALAEAEAEAAAAADIEQKAAAERARCESDLHVAEGAERQAAGAFDALSDRLIYATEAGRAELEEAVAAAEAAVDAATANLEAARRAVAAIDARLESDDVDGGTASGAATAAPSARVEELEWYLLARVAAQRSVSYAGSVPLVLDDALAAVAGDDLVHLLSRLERLSAAVQVIVLSDDEAVVSWAESVGPDRALALSLTAA